MASLAHIQPAVAEDTEITHRPVVPVPPTKRAVLIVVGPGRRGMWELDGRELVIGRDPTCHVGIPADVAASRRHAVIRRRRGAKAGKLDLEIEDLGSLNGTLVNDVVIDGPCALGDHSRVQIGNTVFKLMHRDDEELAAERELLALATQDALTGLLNRGAFDHQVALEFERARRYRRPVGLVMVDIDFFKAVNDRYGHVAGDRVLAEVGRRIKGVVRSCDIAGRYGGEELAVLLPETGLEGAFLTAERVREAVEALSVPDPSGALRVTVSVGVATLTDGHPDIHAFVGSADRALYRAKHRGRNRTCTASD